MAGGAFGLETGKLRRGKLRRGKLGRGKLGRGKLRPFSLETRRDLFDGLKGAHHVIACAFELPDVEANDHAPIEACLGEIDAPIAIDGFDERQIEGVEIACPWRGVAE